MRQGHKLGGGRRLNMNINSLAILPLRGGAYFLPPFKKTGRFHLSILESWITSASTSCWSNQVEGPWDYRTGYIQLVQLSSPRHQTCGGSSPSNKPAAKKHSNEWPLLMPHGREPSVSWALPKFLIYKIMRHNTVVKVIKVLEYSVWICHDKPLK